MNELAIPSREQAYANRCTLNFSLPFCHRCFLLIGAVPADAQSSGGQSSSGSSQNPDSNSDNKDQEIVISPRRVRQASSDPVGSDYVAFDFQALIALGLAEEIKAEALHPRP
jgi:hypothetical protein